MVNLTPNIALSRTGSVLTSLQRWSVLLQTATLSPALEGSGTEVRVIAGLQTASPALAGRCACYLGERSVQIGNVKHG